MKTHLLFLIAVSLFFTGSFSQTINLQEKPSISTSPNQKASSIQCSKNALVRGVLMKD